MNRHVHIALAALVSLGTAQARTGEQEVLQDEPSRSELARYAMLSEGSRAIPRKFEFPKHTGKGKIFGIDVSHHQGKVDWDKVAGQGISFAYVKATQGRSFYDGQFANNWNALKALREGVRPVLRGAYHFMSAVDAPEAQAANFAAKVGKLEERDLPPCLDVEWDFERQGKGFAKDSHGRNIDQWSKLSSKEIVARIKRWLTIVEQTSHKKPVIYTNANWWKEHVGNDRTLAGYKLWIADYTSSSLDSEYPRVPKNFKWALWQLTDQGMVVSAGLTKGLDTNVLAQDDREFGPLFRQVSGSPAPAASP